MKRVIILFLIAGITLGASCKKSKGPKPDPKPEPAPAKAVLVSPANNEACLNGTPVSASESAVEFKWNAAANALGYDLVIKNLVDNKTKTYASAEASHKVTLEKNTPYSWYVVSKSSQSSSSAQSDTWKFYNAGDGKLSYAPFPAEALSPLMGERLPTETLEVTLKWKSSDVDNDISAYSVYFGKNLTPALLNDKVSAAEIKASVQSKSVYYWKVITKDAAGNTSESQLFQFYID